MTGFSRSRSVKVRVAISAILPGEHPETDQTSVRILTTHEMLSENMHDANTWRFKINKI